MDNFFDFVMLSRIQFAVTTLFHIIWPTLSIGLSLFLVTTEALWFLISKLFQLNPKTVVPAWTAGT